MQILKNTRGKNLLCRPPYWAEDVFEGTIVEYLSSTLLNGQAYKMIRPVHVIIHGTGLSKKSLNLDELVKIYGILQLCSQ